jgi:RNA polymerase sigma factor (sigma-70 family)
MSSGPDSSRPTSVVLPGIEADPLFADAVDEAIAGDASTMPGVLDRPVGRDAHDFSSLYVRHRSSFVAHARRYLNDQRDIDEVVQEALLRLFLALPELETELQALAYCRRTVTNLCIDRFRAQARRPRMVGYDEATDTDLWDDSHIDDPIYAAEDAAIVRQALALLSPTHRDALIKREVEEKSLSQIALEMGIPETAVKHTLHRARRSLRRTIATIWEESGQGVKSALVLILAVLLALPFISRGGNSAPSPSSASGSESTATPTGPATVAQPTPTNDVTLPATPGGSADWPNVPQLSLPQVSLPPVNPPTTPAPQPTPDPTTQSPDPAPTPEPTPTPPPTSTPPTDPGPGLKPLLTFALTGEASVAAPELPRQQLFAAATGAAQPVTALSEFTVLTTQGRFSLAQSVARFANGSTDVSVVPSLPQGGDSVAATVVDRSSDISTLANGYINIRARFLAQAAVDVAPGGTPQQTSEISIDLVMSSDLASVVSENVVVTPQIDDGSKGLPTPAPSPTLPGSSTIAPAGAGGSPTGGQSQAQLQQSAVEGVKQVITAS